MKRIPFSVLMLPAVIFFPFFTSCSIDAELLPDEPSTPVNVQAVNPALPDMFDYITVNWDTVENAAQYAVYRSIGNIENYTIIGVTETTNFEDRKVISDAYYIYKIKAYNISGSSALSGPSNIISLPKMAPGNISYKMPPEVIIDGTELNSPQSIKIFGNILFVVDTNNNRIIRKNLDTGEAFWLGWNGIDTKWHSMTDTGYSAGPGYGQFSSPRDIAIDSSGTMYIADYFNFRVQKIAPDGTFIAWLGWEDTGRPAPEGTGWHTTGTATTDIGNGAFIYPSSVALDSDGNIYVSDNLPSPYDVGRVQKFSSNGVYLDKAQNSGTAAGYFSTNISKIYFHYNTLYITDSGNHQIHRLQNSVWKVLTSTTPQEWRDIGGNSSGINDAQFNSPKGVFISNNGYIYISDTNNHRIQMFTGDGYLLGWLGTGSITTGWHSVLSGETAAGPSTFINAPTQTAMDKENNLYVVEEGTDRVLKFYRSIN